MFKQSRFFFSATMIAFVFVSTLILSKPAPARTRCPVELPKTLLSLYLGSNTVVIADIKNENITKSEEGAENDSYVEITRNLDVVKSFKGQKLPEISFSKSEYRAAVKTAESIGDETSIVDGEDVGEFGQSVLAVGKRYLFFLSTDEDGKFFPVDYRVAGREITQENAGTYEKRLSDLGRIIAAKKNQIPRLTEWLVRLTEDEETRWDGAASLSRSFSSLSYEEEPEEGETAPEVTTIDENFDEYTPAIAKNLTEAQKERLSSIFINSLNQSLLAGGENNSDYDYALAELVENWERARFAIYGFGMLQAIDKSDTEKTRRVMNFIADMIDDEQLSASFYDYAEMIREKNVETVSEPIENSQAVSETPVGFVEVPASFEKVEQSAETLGEKTQSTETENIEPQAEELTQEQIREQVFQQFVNRYQELLARNFAPEIIPETEAAIAHTIEESNK